MTVDFFCPRWGSEQLEWDTFLRNVKNAGYRGIEWFPFSEDNNVDKIGQLLKKYDLQFSIVMTVLGDYKDAESYLVLLKEQLTVLARIGDGIAGPLFISAQVGREYFSAEQIDACIACCKQVSLETGIPIYHETHRNKWPYAVHILPPFLESNPDLLLTLDVSHWFCVSESYLQDQKKEVDLAISRSRHVHARVGHTQGSQVTDPALPQYKEALEAHLAIWDQWISERKASGALRCTMTPEFGPPPYLTVLNKDISPQQLQWNLNLWMKELLHNRYNS
jgi:sugar phosphate isomerase/epimerase